MKRKDFENAYDDDFSCFSLTASARKSRRLDCELAPIIEEEHGSGLPMVPDEGFGGAAVVPSEAMVVSDVVVNDPPSEELAIVLYNPGNAATQGLVKSPSSSNFSLVVDPDLLSGWKSHILHQGNQRKLTLTELDEDSDENKSFQSNNAMAVVPWVASQQHLYASGIASEAQAPVMSIEPMEADADYDMMEFEDDHSSPPCYNNQGQINNATIGGPQPPMQQPHCLLPQYAPNTYTPIPW